MGKERLTGILTSMGNQQQSSASLIADAFKFMPSVVIIIIVPSNNTKNWKIG